MKTIVFACLVAFTAARPEYPSPALRSSDSAEVIPILRDERVEPEDGTYSFDFETGDGIVRSESGSRLPIPSSPVGQHGEFSFTLPNGEKFELKFVANEDGYQPESDHLPVAPDFPHEIPDFVLRQIEKAQREDEEALRSEQTRRSESKGHKVVQPEPSTAYSFAR